MRVSQEKVRQFMEKIGELIHDRPALIEFEEAERRARFIEEELQEYREAVAAGDLVGIADALGDLLYVVIGTGTCHGLELAPIFDEIHRSNMTKTAEVKPMAKVIDGRHAFERRCVKGPNYEPPRLAEIVLIQTTRLADAAV